MKFGFFGAGNMASAIIRGVCNHYGKDNILVWDKAGEAMAACQEQYGVCPAASGKDLVQKADVLILAVKPNVIPAVLSEVKGELKDKKILLVSIAAGVSLAHLANCLGFSAPIVRVMPNINAEAGASMTAICGNDFVSGEEMAVVNGFFQQIGETVQLPEAQFPVFMAIASCSPAFTFLFIDALAKGAQKLGMNKKEAVRIAAQAVLGSGKMALQTGEHPQSLLDKVCSPGGTTIEGVCVLQEHRLETGVVKAVEACVNKDAALGEKNA